MIKDQGKWGRTEVCDDDDELGIEAQPRQESRAEGPGEKSARDRGGGRCWVM
jgi:hypothetical protein